MIGLMKWGKVGIWHRYQIPNKDGVGVRALTGNHVFSFRVVNTLISRIFINLIKNVASRHQRSKQIESRRAVEHNIT